MVYYGLCLWLVIAMCQSLRAQRLLAVSLCLELLILIALHFVPRCMTSCFNYFVLNNQAHSGPVLHKEALLRFRQEI